MEGNAGADCMRDYTVTTATPTSYISCGADSDTLARGYFSDPSWDSSCETMSSSAVCNCDYTFPTP